MASGIFGQLADISKREPATLGCPARIIVTRREGSAVRAENCALYATRWMLLSEGFRPNRGTCSDRRFEWIGRPFAAGPNGCRNHHRYHRPAYLGLSIWPGGRGRAAIPRSAPRGHCRGRGNSTRSLDAPGVPQPHPSNRTFHPIGKLSSWTAAPIALRVRGCAQ